MSYGVNEYRMRKSEMERAWVSTANPISDIRPKVGRPKRWSEDMQARFAEGTFARIRAVLRGKEDRTDFVRAAVERELARRERMRSRQAARKVNPPEKDR